MPSDLHTHTVYSDGKLTPEDLDEEVTITTGGLQETGVYPLRLGLDQVQHGINLTGIRKHFPVGGDTLLGLNLCIS